ncbi:hypothetical protein ABC955_16035 [Citromicrobium bathyomarinum]
MGRLGTLCRIGIAATAVSIAMPAQAASLDELAREAVFDLCPDLMEIETPLQDEPSIKARGYEFLGSRTHNRAGRLDIVSLDADDGTITIGNSRETSFCQVGISGEGAKATFAAIYASRDALGSDWEIDWFEDTNPVPDIPGAEIVSLRTATVDGLYWGVQFVDLSATKPDFPLFIQQYFLEEE